jgi:hypothetical protein
MQSIDVSDDDALFAGIIHWEAHTPNGDIVQPAIGVTVSAHNPTYVV